MLGLTSLEVKLSYYSCHKKPKLVDTDTVRGCFTNNVMVFQKIVYHFTAKTVGARDLIFLQVKRTSKILNILIIQ